MRVLIVGAGAVGQVYGRHLQAGGAEVAFYVKPKYEADARAGFAMYRLRRRGRRTPERFAGFGVHTTVETVAAEPWDQVWLTVATDALAGDWLGPFLDAVGDAVVVSLQPGLEARRVLEARVPPERLVWGVIVMIAYHGPLEGETLPEPGVCYTLPPLSASPFSGPREAVDAAVRTLKRGGCRARRHRDAAAMSATGSAFLMPHIVGLEGAGWSLSRYRRGEWLRRAVAASHEAARAVAGAQELRLPAVRFLLRRWSLRLVWWLAPKVVPLDLETYLRTHFLKVRPQTVLMVQDYLAQAAASDVAAPALEAMGREVLGIGDASA